MSPHTAGIITSCIAFFAGNLLYEFIKSKLFRNEDPDWFNALEHAYWQTVAVIIYATTFGKVGS